ncbi:MAG: hypothetical protein ACI8QC_004293 [Planctomycetota bacterium]|jgi:uncharacterized protein (DUF1330 family)
MSSTTLVVTALPNPTEMGAVRGYLEGVMPLFMGAGGQLVKRLKVEEVVHGDRSGMVLVMDFDSAETLRELFSSEAYAALIPGRDKGFAQFNALIAAAL